MALMNPSKTLSVVGGFQLVGVLNFLSKFKIGDVGLVSKAWVIVGWVLFS